MSIADKLTQLATIKSNIKSAIIAKGQTVGDDMTAYATAIGNISGGSSSSSSPQIVGWINYNKLPEYYDLNGDGNSTIADNTLAEHARENIDDMYGALNYQYDTLASFDAILKHPSSLTNSKKKYLKDLWDESSGDVDMPVAVPLWKGAAGQRWIVINLMSILSGSMVFSAYAVYDGIPEICGLFAYEDTVS